MKILGQFLSVIGALRPREVQNGAKLLKNEIDFVNSITPMIDPNCPDYNLGLKCADQCVLEMIECYEECDAEDFDCRQRCGRDQVNCSNDCPCHAHCIDGCNGCNNRICTCDDSILNDDPAYSRCLLEAEEALGDCILHNCDEGDDECLATCEEKFEIQYHDCPCQLNCPNGCPCRNFDCDPAGSHGVLIFSRDMGRDSDSYIPKLVNFRGVESEGLTLAIQNETFIQYGCSVVYRNSMHYFGGSGDNADQHLVFNPKNKDCSLESHPHAMPMNFTWGSCEVSTMKGHWNDPYADGRVLLCHSTQNTRGCWTYDGKRFRELHVEDSNNSDKLNSNYYHRHTSLGTYDGWPITVGDTDGRGGLNGGNKTEILTFNIHSDGAFEWTEFAEFPFAAEQAHRIYQYAMVSMETSVVIFGGTTNKDIAGVYEFQNGKWHMLGNHNTVRRGHAAVYYEGINMIIGGASRRMTEIWDTTTDKFYEPEEFKPELNNYDSYPATIVVRNNICGAKPPKQ